MSVVSVVKNAATGVAEENVYGKWATIDVVSDPTFHDGIPTRIRVDLIGSIRPFSVKNADGTYSYLTQINTIPTGTWYTAQKWETLASKLLSCGWGSGAVQPWIDPNDPNATKLKAQYEKMKLEEEQILQLAKLAESKPTLNVQPNRQEVAQVVPADIANICFALVEYVKRSNAAFEDTGRGRFKRWRENRAFAKYVRDFALEMMEKYQGPNASLLFPEKIEE